MRLFFTADLEIVISGHHMYRTIDLSVDRQYAIKMLPAAIDHITQVYQKCGIPAVDKICSLRELKWRIPEIPVFQGLKVTVLEVCHYAERK